MGFTHCRGFLFYYVSGHRPERDISIANTPFRIFQCLKERVSLLFNWLCKSEKYMGYKSGSSLRKNNFACLWAPSFVPPNFYKPLPHVSHPTAWAICKNAFVDLLGYANCLIPCLRQMLHSAEDGTGTVVFVLPSRIVEDDVCR
jgi:hypothetical protein